LAIYGTETPPDIALNNIKTVPIAMFVGAKDDLSDPKDAQWAKDQIKSVVHYEEIENMDQGSFMMGKDMTYFDNVIDVIKKNSGGSKNEAMTCPCPKEDKEC